MTFFRSEELPSGGEWIGFRSTKATGQSRAEQSRELRKWTKHQLRKSCCSACRWSGDTKTQNLVTRQRETLKAEWADKVVPVKKKRTVPESVQY